MLAFDRPVPTLADAFFDGADPRLVHLLPDRLAPIDRDGAPELSLVIHSDAHGRGGGLFQARFAASRPAPAGLSDMSLRPAEIVGARLRVTPRTSVAQPEAFNTWHEAVLDGTGGVLVDLVLDPIRAELMRRLALEGGDALDLSFEFDVAGSTAGLPVRVDLPGEPLWDVLSARLGAEAVGPDRIEAAFLSLPEGMARMSRIGGGPLPDRNTVLREVALRSTPLIFDRDTAQGTARFRLIDRDRAAAFSLALDRPRAELRTHRLDWSLSGFVAGLDAAGRTRHFPQLRTVEPFAEAEIKVLNEIPLNARHAVSATVDLTCPGPGGTPENHTVRFRPDDPVVGTVRTRYPAIATAFEVQSRVKLLIAPGAGGGFPRIWPGAPAFARAENPFVVHISPSRLNVAVVHLVGLEGLFALCRALRATFEHDGGATTVLIDAAHPEAHVILPGHRNGTAYRLRLEALAPEGMAAADHLLRDGPDDAPRIVIGAIDLIVKAPDRVACRIADPKIRFAVIEIRFSGHVTTRVLRPGSGTEIAVWRPSVFAPLSYDWRAAEVREDDTGHTQPLAHGDWTAGTEREIALA